MKSFRRGIYLIPFLWVAWVLYHFGIVLKRKGVIVLTTNTGETIVKVWNGSFYEPMAPDPFSEFFYSLLILITFAWVFVGIVKLVIRFFVRTIQEEKRKIEEEHKTKT